MAVKSVVGRPWQQVRLDRPVDEARIEKIKRQMAKLMGA